VGTGVVVFDENAGHWGANRVRVRAEALCSFSSYSSSSSSSYYWSSCIEIGVDLKVLGRRVLDEMKQSHRDYEQREYQLKEPIEVQRHCRDKHLRMHMPLILLGFLIHPSSSFISQYIYIYIYILGFFFPLISYYNSFKPNQKKKREI
jgi:hypothetical protein